MEDEMSKRELVATLIFAAMHAAPNESRADEGYAVIQADRLLSELNQKGRKGNERNQR